MFKVVCILISLCVSHVFSLDLQAWQSHKKSCQSLPGNAYAWLTQHEGSFVHLKNSIDAPLNYKRLENDKPWSFAKWLQCLPIDSNHEGKLLLYNGEASKEQHEHYQVVAMPIGKNNLLQCADTVMKLLAEYKYFIRKHNAKNKKDIPIQFKSVSYKTLDWDKWVSGTRYTTKKNGRKLNEINYPQHAGDRSYSNFLNYLTTTYLWGSTFSLGDNFNHPKDAKFNVGDVLIKKPKFNEDMSSVEASGHAIIVVDKVYSEKYKHYKYMFVQGRNPARQVHIIKNNLTHQPWFSADELNIRSGFPRFNFDKNQHHFVNRFNQVETFLQERDQIAPIKTLPFRRHFIENNAKNVQEKMLEDYRFLMQKNAKISSKPDRKKWWKNNF